ncbi:MAG: LytR/AlgR family response regulator transcription factor [Candidatus Methylacidiphilales bacterium]
MHKTINILIVEDEVLIAEDLKEILFEVGYTNVFKARNYAKAIEEFDSKSIDLVLLDINLNDAKSGIDLGLYINQNLNLPFIYITSYSDAETIASVKQTKPSAFLLKPYNKAHLLASIEIAFFNYSTNLNAADKPNEDSINNETENELIINGQFLIKDGYRYVKVPLNEILWFESDKNYIEINTLEKKYLLRTSLKKLQVLLPADQFVKCNKQFIINLKQVDSFDNNSIEINGQQISISRTEQLEVLKKLKM